MSARFAEYFDREHQELFGASPEPSTEEPILRTVSIEAPITYALRKEQGEALTDHYFNSRQLLYWENQR